MRQREALALMCAGNNIFLTGEPGSGKSHTLRTFCAFLRAEHRNFAVTASTGIAATHIGGTTIHAWSGIGIAKHLTKKACKDRGKINGCAKRIANTEVLIIDEVSMLDAQVLDTVDLMCRVHRTADLPFGGMQVVFVGDFFQLPPVARHDEPPAKFAFQSDAWQSLDLQICYLDEQHRQEDPLFLELLRDIRKGSPTAKHLETLQTRIRKTAPEHTKLFCTNLDVDTMNAEHLSRIKEPLKAFTMTTFGNPKAIEQLQRGCLSPERLELKKGARVMVTKNLPSKRLVNGSIGIVEDFAKETHLPLVRFPSGSLVSFEPEVWSFEGTKEEQASIRQIPLRLAWAITIHKSQGMSLSEAYIDLEKTFTYGQGYVALSRVRTLAGITLKGISPRALEVHPDILVFDNHLRTASKTLVPQRKKTLF